MRKVHRLNIVQRQRTNIVICFCGSQAVVVVSGGVLYMLQQ